MKKSEELRALLDRGARFDIGVWVRDNEHLVMRALLAEEDRLERMGSDNGQLRHGAHDTEKKVVKRVGRGTQRWAALCAHYILRDRGLTDFELAAMMHLPVGRSSARTRRDELVRLGLVEKTDERRLSEGATSEAIVWRITPSGVSYYLSGGS